MNKIQSFNLNKKRGKKLFLTNKNSSEIQKWKLISCEITQIYRDDIGRSRYEQVQKKEIELRRIIVATFLKHPITDTEYLDSITKFSHITSTGHIMYCKNHELGMFKIEKGIEKFKITFTPNDN